MTLLLMARLLLAWVFVRAGLDVLRKPEPRAESAGWLLDGIRGIVPLMPADNVLLVRANAALQVGAGALLASDRQPRLAALLLAASMVPTTIGGHAFWRQDDTARRAQQEVHFNKNLAILGGLLLIVLDTPIQGRRRRRGWR